MNVSVCLTRWAPGLAFGLVLCGLAATGPQAAAPGGPVKVTIRDEKPVVVEAAVPYDPTPRLQYTPSNLSVQVRDEKNRTLHLSHFISLMVDGQFHQQGIIPGGRFEKSNVPLGPTAGGTKRQGFTSVFVAGDLHYTMVAELVPTKLQKGEAKRRMDSVLISYEIENKGKQSHKVGLRVYMDTYVITNDGCQFAAPTHPNKVIDGIELKGKTLPDYVQMLEQPNLDAPGFVAHLTLNLGSRFEKAERVVLTRHGAGFGGWEMPVMASMGDSGMGVFWEPAEIKPGAKRKIAYAYGQGIAVAPESEGRFEVQLAGSFEPGKLFSITAMVHDPVAGQSLMLELPDGMEPVEGKLVQPVPTPLPNQARSVVMWKARVRELGDYPLRIRSSTGVTQTKNISIQQAAN